MVLHVLEALRGGVSRHIVDVVRTTPDIDHHIAVPQTGRAATASGAVFDQAALDSLAAAGARLHPVEMRRTPFHPANLAAIRALRRLIRSVGPDVVHGHSGVGGALARMAATGTGVPAFYTPNGVSPLRASLAVEKFLGRLTTTLVAVSESEADLVTRLGLVPSSRVAVVPNGIDVALPDGADAGPDGRAPDIRALTGIPDGAPVVGTIMRLVPQKAPGLFVEVCAEVAKSHPEAHFVMIGLGPLQDFVDQAVTAAGITDRWHQIPHLPGAAATMGQMDVFALLSAFEGGPYAPLEAMRAGTAVVLTDVVGNRDLIEPGRSGLMAAFGDVPALAASIGELLSDPGRRRSVGAAGRRRLEARFDVQKMGASLAELYQRSAGLDHQGAGLGLTGAA